jgi:prepilin peptidase CpaA
MTILGQAAAAMVAALLVWGAVIDVRRAKIPNRLTMTGVILAPIAAFAVGGVSAALLAVAAVAVAFVIGFGGFAFGAIGGGDAKFLMVGAGFVGLSNVVAFLVAAGCLGGILAVAQVVRRRAGTEATVMTLDLAKNVATLGRKGHRARLSDQGRLTVPYGVAIAAAALLVHFTPLSEWLYP